MPARDGRAERARRRIRRQVLSVGDDVRRHRLLAGLSIRACSKLTGVSPSAWSRLERGRLDHVTMERLALVADAVGLEPSLKLYPTDAPVRDAAHLRLLERLRERLNPELQWRTEVPLRVPGDVRAWDAVIRSGKQWIPVEAETRLADLQALERRVNLKLRDGGSEHVILLVAGTRNNRTALRAAPPAWTAAFPTGTRGALVAMRAGRLPAGSALVLL